MFHFRLCTVLGQALDGMLSLELTARVDEVNYALHCISVQICCSLLTVHIDVQIDEVRGLALHCS